MRINLIHHPKAGDDDQPAEWPGFLLLETGQNAKYLVHHALATDAGAGEFDVQSH